MTTSLTIELLEARIAPARFLPTLSSSGYGGFPGLKIVVPDGEIDKVTNIGDFNGDGLSDIAISVPQLGFNPGKVYVVYGRSDGLPPVLDLGTLNGTNGFVISGKSQFDYFGYSVDGGDINGDGKSDLAIGAPLEGPGGVAYVIFGTQTNSSTLSLSSINGTNGFSVSAPAENQFFGASVAIGGSINGDGFGELIVGGPADPRPLQLTLPTPLVAVVFGKASGFANLSGFSSLNGTTGFTVTATGGWLGTVVNILDDINGDGKAELNLGASREGVLPLSLGDGESDPGYIIFGQNGPWAATYNIANFEAPEGIAIRDMRGAEIGSFFRTSDVNADGTTDLLGFGGFIRGGKLFIGGFAAPRTDSGMPSGSYFPEEWDIIGILDSMSLRSVGGNVYIDGGDFNGDGYIDMIVDAKSSSLIFGSNISRIHYVGKKDTGLAIEGLSSNRFGPRVQFIGDFNADGFDDLALQWSTSVNGTLQERLTIIYGSDVTFSRDGKSASWTDTDGDTVKLKVSKGRLEYSMFQFAPTDPEATGRQIDFLKLPLVNGGYDLTISVTKNLETGDGLIDIGKIDGNDGYVNNLRIAGNVGEFDSPYTGKTSLFLHSLGLMPDGNLAGASELGTAKKIVLTGNLYGDLSINGSLKTLSVREIADGVDIAFKSNIGLIQAVSIGDATIAGGSITKLLVTGDQAAGIAGNFKASLSLDNEDTVTKRPVLTSAIIAGLVRDAVFDVVGNIGKISLGAMENSHILAGFHATSAADPLAGGTFLTSASIDNLVITGIAAPLTASGLAYANSSIIAAALGRILVTTADDTNGGTAFGFGFRDSITSLVVYTPNFTYNTVAGGTQSSGDFKVIKL